MRYVFAILLILLILISGNIQATEDKELPISIDQTIQAAKQGDALAQYNLGVMYDKGKGVPHDYKLALEWYTKAAEKGLAAAQNSLGFMYFHGESVPQDYKLAVEWFTKAAEKGDAYAQSNLGTMYGKGYGVPQDYKQAYAWFNIASAQGYKAATKERNIASELLEPASLSEAQELSNKYYKLYVEPFQK